MLMNEYYNEYQFISRQNKILDEIYKNQQYLLEGLKIGVIDDETFRKFWDKTNKLLADTLNGLYIEDAKN